MKKSFILLPLVAMVLTACSSNDSSTESTSAEVTSVAVPSWQSDVQPVAMPSSMTQPRYQPQPSYQPMPQPAPMPSYGQPTSNAQSSGYGQTESVGNCQVVRDSSNTPVYAQIQKGCYTDSSYTVGKSDTVFLIAYLSGKSVADIARLNNLSQPYQLRTGQVLRLR